MVVRSSFLQVATFRQYGQRIRWLLLVSRFQGVLLLYALSTVAASAPTLEGQPLPLTFHMAVLITVVLTLLFAGWVVRTYPAFTFTESLTRAAKHLWNWIKENFSGRI
jgi:uncharacterized protein (DUF58 family)